MNKKILALLMALLMVVMSSVAFAEDAKPFTKVYTVSGGTSPEVTFSFEVGNGSVVEGSTSSDVTAPAKTNITVDSVTFDAAGEKEIKLNVNLDAFTEVGVYTYPLNEVNDKIAGVNYDTDNMTIYVFVAGTGEKVVSVKKDGVKSEDGKDLTVENEYQAGSLEITKQVTGNYGDPNKKFEITVTLTGAEGQDYSKANILANGEKIDVGTAKTFEIKHGEKIEITNIPHDVTYTVEEADYTSLGYDEPDYAFSDENKTIDGVEKDTVTVTNNKDGEGIETGVFTDNMPYFMLMAFVLVLAAAVVLKKRTVNE